MNRPAAQTSPPSLPAPSGAVRGDVAVGIDFESNRLGTTKLRRNVKWLRPNAHRRGQPAPWLLEVPFGGSGNDVLETRFRIESP